MSLKTYKGPNHCPACGLHPGEIGSYRREGEIRARLLSQASQQVEEYKAEAARLRVRAERAEMCLARLEALSAQ